MNVMSDVLMPIIRRNNTAHRLYSCQVIGRQLWALRRVRRELREHSQQLVSKSSIKVSRGDLSKTCHIIGSGWSLRHSVPLIDPQRSFIMGFNNAGLTGLPFDLYMMEFAGRQYRGLAAHQSALLHKYVVPKCSRIYFKNLWRPHNDVATAVEYFGGIAGFLSNIELPCLREESLRAICSRLIDNRGAALIEYKSTALSLIGLASFLGFKEIVMHGIDFGGTYFFQDKEWSIPAEFLPPTDGGFYRYASSGSASHVTNSDRLGLAAALRELSSLLGVMDTHVMSATGESPLSKLFPVWRR